MLTQQVSAVAVDHQSQGCPAIAPGPHSTKIRGPALIGCLGHRKQGLDARPRAHRALANLPAPELEDTLHGVHVAPEQVRHRAVTEGRVQIKGPAGLRDRGLALDDAQNQGCFGHGCPALDVVFHQGAHRRFLSR